MTDSQEDHARDDVEPIADEGPATLVVTTAILFVVILAAVVVSGIA